MQRQGGRPLAAWVVGLWLCSCGPKINPGGSGLADDGNATTASAAQAAALLSAAGCTTTAVGYAAGASAAVQTNCGSCHANGQQPLLATYAQAKAGFAAGGGLEAISSAPPTMPIGRNMSALDKCTLLNWAAGNYAP